MYKIIDYSDGKAIVDENNEVVCMGTQQQLENIMEVLKLFRTSVGIIKRWPKEDGSGEDVEDGELEYFLHEISKIKLHKLIEFKKSKDKMAIRRIIIEGADQQGKSTLAKYLAEKLNWDIVHFGKPPQDFNFFTDYIVPEHCISDRNFMSEIVYSRVNKQDCRIDKLELLQQTLTEYGTILIMLSRGENFQFDRDRQEEYNMFQICQAMSFYKEEFDNITMVKYFMNPNSTMYESTVDLLVQLIKCQSK